MERTYTFIPPKRRTDTPPQPPTGSQQAPGPNPVIEFAAPSAVKGTRINEGAKISGHTGNQHDKQGNNNAGDRRGGKG
eukprot:CAMPEP_0197857006 /NCGR_PEP_ID=MMETSP1438-20131217/29662_1 /TAXON_ID=1461541 /ORGANISM="Pterosperma sp., Strain CCMP1384" /LENGTH=77 /DNA_ID=CAMNT_0043472675 /DNA_START=20 /DNA_END=250 /DNA_ORIENTATION=+